MACPSPPTVSNVLKALGCLLGLASVPLLLAACGTSTSGSATTTTVSVPAGWTNHPFGRVAIAVPSDWAVKHDAACPNAHAPGTLMLGVSPVLVHCPAFEFPASVVTVSQLTATTSTTIPVGQKPTTVNGVPVLVEFGSPTSLSWSVPSLDVHIIGMGPDAGRVLHTIHRS